MSRAPNSHHGRMVKDDGLEEVKVPRVHLDYFFMSKWDEAASKIPSSSWWTRGRGRGLRGLLGARG